jgi:surface antigen
MRNQAEMTRAFVAGGRIAVIASAVALAGCGTTGSKGAVASLGSSSTRGVSSTAYIAALQGGVIGRLADLDIGTSDRQRALEAEYRALEAAPGGQPVEWAGRGVSGSVVAAAPYQVGSQNCRQYSHTVTVKSQPKTARGAACRNPDGSWTPL